MKYIALLRGINISGKKYYFNEKFKRRNRTTRI